MSSYTQTLNWNKIEYFDYESTDRLLDWTMDLHLLFIYNFLYAEDDVL